MGKRKNATKKAKEERRNRRKKIKNKKNLQQAVKNKLFTELPDNAYFSDSHTGSVYRFFDKESYADDFAKGEIFLGTLNTYRAIEDDRVDSEEGYQDFHADNFGGKLDDPVFKKRMHEVGMEGMFKGNGSVQFNGVTIRNVIPDAYVICATTDYLTDYFGEKFNCKYCVEITQPKKFFCAITKKIERLRSLEGSRASKVTYADRHFSGNDSPKDIIGFVKPAETYSEEKEFRFLWLPNNKDNLERITISCPEVSKFCKKIP